jgi:hypothetical protein
VGVCVHVQWSVILCGMAVFQRPLHLSHQHKLNSLAPTLVLLLLKVMEMFIADFDSTNCTDFNTSYFILKLTYSEKEFGGFPEHNFLINIC